MTSLERALFVLALVLLPVSSGAAGPDAPAAKAADRELQERIHEAIDRGAEWLVGRQDPGTGSFSDAFQAAYPMGPTGLATLALLHSGVPRNSDAIKRAFAYLREQYDAQKRGMPRAGTQFRAAGLRTYSVAVTVMALAEFGRERRTVMADDGRYGGAAGAGFRLSEPDLAWMREMTGWLVGSQGRGGVWRYPSGGFDHSNSQYALLALKEARRMGIEVPEIVFAKALSHFMKSQESHGKKIPRYVESGGDGIYTAARERIPGHDRARGWGYTGPFPTTGSMTTAGVAALAICRGELRSPRYRKLAAQSDQRLRDGLAWLGENFSVRDNPRQGATWHYYYLYGLERAGVLSRVVYMGKHRWYAEGARYLVDCQGPDGAWRTAFAGAFAGGGGRIVPGDGNVVDQSFALLFLARATARALGVATEQPLLDLSRAEKLPDSELRKLFDASIAELERLGDEARAKRRREFALLGPRLIPFLLPGLSAAEEAVRRRSVEILRAATGLAFGYDPAAARADRESAADRWITWYLRARKNLALDRDALRIR